MRLKRQAIGRAGVCGAALLAACVFAAGCTLPTNARLSVWIVDDSAEVTPDSNPSLENDIYSASRGVVRLVSAINETLGLQVVLRTDGPSSAGYNIRVTDLSGPSGTLDARQTVRTYRAHYVLVSEFKSWYPRHTGRAATPRLIPDALVPLYAPRGGAPLMLDGTRNEVIWVDLRVPPSVDPGLYTGRLDITRVGRRQAEFSSRIELRVLPVALPSAPSLAVVCRVAAGDLLREHLRWKKADLGDVRLLPDAPNHQAAIRLIHRTMQIFQAHRLNPVLWSSFPKFRPRGERTMDIEWGPYDALVSGWLDGSAFEDGVGLARWPLPASATYPSPRQQGGFESPQYARTLAAYLDACKRHFEDKGWADKALLRLQPPGELEQDRIQHARRLSGIVRQSETGLEMIAHFPPMSLRGLGWFNAPTVELGGISVWAPPAMWYEPRAMARQRSLGRETWFIPDRPPYSGSPAIEAPAMDPRSLAWQAFRYAADGIWIEHAAEFGDDPFEGNETSTGASDALIYPGTRFGLTEEPLGSVRLKRMRRGMFDYELLRLLETHGKSLLARTIARQIVRHAHTDASLDHLLDARAAGWSRDPAMMSLARRVLLSELAAEFEPLDPSGREVIGLHARLARLMDQAARVRAVADGARLFQGADGGLRARIFGYVTNPTDQPLDGRWTTPSPPLGWRQEADALTRVAPRGRATAEVEYALAGLGSNPDGVYQVPLELHTEQLGTLIATARVAVAICRFVEEPPRIDGDLSDWISASNNVAADFRLCREADPSDAVDADKPVLATRASFCHDNRTLYIAVRCALKDGDSPVWQADNDVPIDGIMPWGQETVEIIINAANDLRGDSADLYILQIKPSGLVVARHGCRTAPPVGRSEPWESGVRARVVTTRQEWIVELALPFASLGPDAFNNTMWGFNVTRLDAARGEYSSWSGARRHCYSPQSLGNLVVLRP